VFDDRNFIVREKFPREKASLHVSECDSTLTSVQDESKKATSSSEGIESERERNRGFEGGSMRSEDAASPRGIHWIKNLRGRRDLH
jgi:hypothetical protein